ncbi:TPA: aldo/keto reductase [Escherichia coli]
MCHYIQDAGFESTRAAFERSLKRLQLEYLDTYLIHQPYADVYGSWRAMENLYEEKAIRAIGVSNFSPARLTDLMAFNRIAPMLNQVEVNPYYQQAEKVKFFREQGVQTVAWAPFAEGKNGLFTHPELSKIAARHDKSVAQIVLRCLIQRDIGVVPKSVTPERIRQNLDVFSFSLSDEDIEIIGNIDTGKSCFIDHDDPERIRWISSVKFNTRCVEPRSQNVGC